MTDFSQYVEDDKGRLIHPVLCNTAKDGSGTWYFPVVSSEGVLIAGGMKEVRVTKALEAAIAYTAGDVLSESDTPSAGTAWTFAAIARANGAYGIIHTAMIISESEAITPRLSLYLFNTTPTCELDDNEAAVLPVHADLAKFVGVINFVAMTSQGDESFVIATPATADQLPLAFKCAAAADDLIGVLVTEDAFTQTATDDMTVVLIAEQL